MQTVHPVIYLFEEIYRTYWGISSAPGRPDTRGLIRFRRRKRDLLVPPERRQD